MLEKTIKTVLKKKVKDWLSSIDDENLVQVIKKDLVITGGCFTSFLENENPKDYDIYFRTKETVIAVAKYYVKKFNEQYGPIKNAIGITTKAFVLTGDMFKIEDNICTIIDPGLFNILGGKYKTFGCNSEEDSVSDENFQGLTRMIVNTPEDRVKIFISSDGIAGQIKRNNMEDLELGGDPVDVIAEANKIPDSDLEKDTDKYAPVFLSTNAITLSDGIQIIVRFYGEPEQIHETYDFAHTKAYWCYHENDVIIPKEVYEAVINKTLIYTGSKYPVCSVIRMRKFIKRGWKINAGQILKMAMQISDLNLTDIDVLEDQLVGVDSLYFAMLIKQFRQQREKDSNWTFDSGYVLSIIDKIF